MLFTLGMNPTHVFESATKTGAAKQAMKVSK